MNKKIRIPLIKEYRITKLIKVLKCFNKFPRDREKQRDCILRLYPAKTEKSVFRGMVIPSLRDLGLIFGYEDMIRLSANGKLLLESEKRGNKELMRVSRIILLEIDKEKFHLIQRLKRALFSNSNINKKDFIVLQVKGMEGISEKQKVERINKWINILEGCGLIKSRGTNFIKLQKENLRIAESELESKIDVQKFRNILFKEYRKLPYSETAGIIDIALLRELVALNFYRGYGTVLTESKFDSLLRKLCFATEKYAISLGHPMGAEEKLFYYNGEYYRTLSITMFERKEVENNA